MYWLRHGSVNILFATDVHSEHGDLAAEQNAELILEYSLFFSSSVCTHQWA